MEDCILEKRREIKKLRDILSICPDQETTKAYIQALHELAKLKRMEIKEIIKMVENGRD